MNVSADLMKRVIHGRADANFQDRYGNNPLSIALGKNVPRGDELDLLHRRETKGHSGRTTVIRAIARNNHDMVDWLTKNEANLTIQSRYGVRPIDLARLRKQLYGSSVEIVKTIEEAIGETEIRDIHGFRGVWDLFSDD